MSPNWRRRATGRDSLRGRGGGFGVWGRCFLVFGFLGESPTGAQETSQEDITRLRLELLEESLWFDGESQSLLRGVVEDSVDFLSQSAAITSEHVLSLMKFFTYCADLPVMELDQASVHNMQIRLLRFAETLQRLLRAYEVISGRSEGWQLIDAVLTAAAAAMPVCRSNDVCLVDKLSLALWRFGMAGDRYLHETGFGNRLLTSLRPAMPWYARWASPWQCPPMFDPRIEARPFWPLEALPRDSAVFRLVTLLREHAAEIEEDLRSGILSEEGAAFIRQPAWSGLTKTGSWMAFVVYRSVGFDGRQVLPRRLDPLHCRIVPSTCRILEEAGVPVGIAHNDLPSVQGTQEVVDFLRAEPGTVVSHHTASTNSRLTVQLCLAGCGEDGETYLQVATERSRWRRGEPVVFDDSFLHAVQISSNQLEPRWVLSMAVLHPAIETPERWVKHFARRESVEMDPRQQANRQQGGPPPPPLEDGDEAFTISPLSVNNRLSVPVMLQAQLWGPVDDGPPTFVGEVYPAASRPHDKDRGLTLPPMGHRTRLSVRNVTDGTELCAWRVDCRRGSARRFEVTLGNDLGLESSPRCIYRSNVN
eukprot:TRINITY_DN63218_c0_g1_i1.p1 TRINITY_DN63218_c0_g1~~TRINITY_DN63218_c0_g1_i1.p1  ORF type:complete len:590 (-),score=74.30 TRINITY_DN63218_c0_g1_i1:318-2087(-)